MQGSGCCKARAQYNVAGGRGPSISDPSVCESQSVFSYADIGVPSSIDTTGWAFKGHNVRVHGGVRVSGGSKGGPLK